MKAKVHTAPLAVMVAVTMTLATLLACGSGAVDASEPEALGHGSWAEIFDSTQEATDGADLVVVGKIKASAFGRDNGFEVNPTEYTNFTVTVEEVLKGAFSGKELVIEMIGSADTVWFSEMPEFRVGEKHLLFLTTFDWHASTAGYRVMGPTARYKIDDGTLESTSDIFGFTRAMDGKSLTAAKGEIAAAVDDDEEEGTFAPHSKEEGSAIMMYLIHLTPAGLVLDIIGFLLVYVFRKDIVETISNRAPRDDEGKDGDWWVEHPGLSDEEVRKHREKQRRVDRIAFIALGTISVGFVFQIVGSVASNLQ